MLPLLPLLRRRRAVGQAKCSKHLVRFSVRFVKTKLELGLYLCFTITTHDSRFLFRVTPVGRGPKPRRTSLLECHLLTYRLQSNAYYRHVERLGEAFMLPVLAPEAGYSHVPLTAMLELIHVEHSFNVHAPLVRTRGLDTSTRGTATIESPLKRKGPVPGASLSRVVGRTVSTVNHSSHVLATNQMQPQPQCSKLKCGQWSTVRWSMYHYRFYTHGRFPRY